jgi:putative ABC transport system ATP-binding protein
MPASTPTRPAGPALRAAELTKRYGRGNSTVTALRQVTLEFGSHSFTAIMGPSGSGKTTFLQCAAGLERPTSGSVWLGQTELTALREPALTVTRRDHIGFVFQSFNLIPSLSVRQNILLPFGLARRPPDQAWVNAILAQVGLADRLAHLPAELSGGQQQRVAVARALATQPDVIFADEPTGNLDTRAGRDTLTLLREAADRFGQTVIMVTHDPVAASYADLVLFLQDGRFADELANPTAGQVAGRMTQLERTPLSPGELAGSRAPRSPMSWPPRGVRCCW